MGKKKYIENPDKLWELFLEYKSEVKDNPIMIVEQKRGNTILPKDLSNVSTDTLKEAMSNVVQLPAQRPLTFIGFQNYLDDQEIISDVTDYFENKDNRYSDYVRICSRIKRNIQEDQISGGMAGIYNPSITQRLNSLTDNIDLSTKGKELNSAPNSINIKIIKPIEEDE